MRRGASGASSSGAVFDSAMRALELAHPVDERRDAFDRHRVVDRRAHAADSAMTFEVRQSALGRTREKRLVQAIVGEEEGYVHARAVRLSHAVAIEAGAVDFGVEH